MNFIAIFWPNPEAIRIKEIKRKYRFEWGKAIDAYDHEANG